jgi:hypothetical protein
VATLNNDSRVTCMNGTELSLQKEEINNAINILQHMVTRARDD